MTRYVIDPATLLRIATEDLAPGAHHQLVAPGFIRSEALAVLLDAVRCGELSETQALALHERMTAVKLRLLADRVSRRTAWTIARERPSTSLRDAEYVAITQLQADALVTTDPTLAAVADGLVVLAPFSELSSPSPHAS